MPKKDDTTLEALVAQGRKLLQASQDPVGFHRDFQQWDGRVATWLDARFPDTGHSARWSAVSRSGLILGRHYYDDDASWRRFHDAVQARLAWLSDFARAALNSGTKKTPTEDRAPVPSTHVFLVHGHDQAAREGVARALERLGLDAVILHEQPNQGRTIIEKFEAYADVRFAVVLLTGDDVGGPAGGSSAEWKRRPRQNVLLELGYFLGKLGRQRVCALYEAGVETPSDYDGVVYVKLDSDRGWEAQLARELRAAGLPVDLNRL